MFLFFHENYSFIIKLVFEFTVSSSERCWRMFWISDFFAKILLKINFEVFLGRLINHFCTGKFQKFKL